MSTELIAILAVGVGLLSAVIALGGTMIALINQSERRSNQRMDRLEDRMDQGFEQLRAEMTQLNGSLRDEMNRRFDEQDVRIRGLEQGQAYLSGQLSAIKDYFTHDSASGNVNENGD